MPPYPSLLHYFSFYPLISCFTNHLLNLTYFFSHAAAKHADIPVFLSSNTDTHSCKRNRLYIERVCAHGYYLFTRVCISPVSVLLDCSVYVVNP